MSHSPLVPGECEEAPAWNAGNFDDSGKTLRRVSPDSTACCVDLSDALQYSMKAEQTDVNVFDTTGNVQTFKKSQLYNN